MLRSFEGEDAVPRAILDEARRQKEDAERAIGERPGRTMAFVTMSP